MGSLSDQAVKDMAGYILSLADEFGGYRPSSEMGYMGLSDSLLSDFAAAVYAAELALTLGFELLYPEKTAEFIRARQLPDGRFRSLDPRPGIWEKSRYGYKYAWQTCMGARGLKALGKTPKYDPRPFMESYIRETVFEKFYPLDPDFCANFYVALDDWMPRDCEERLCEFIQGRQLPHNGWIVEREDFAAEYNNAMTFHSARFYHLGGKVIPLSDKILDQYLAYQQEDGSWSKGGVHGTFDACVVLRILGDGSRKYQNAIERAAGWALGCQSEDHGFSHFGDKPSEMDACYFQIGTLVMAGWIPDHSGTGNRWIGWGHTLKGGNW